MSMTTFRCVIRIIYFNATVTTRSKLVDTNTSTICSSLEAWYTHTAEMCLKTIYRKIANGVTHRIPPGADGNSFIRSKYSTPFGTGSTTSSNSTRKASCARSGPILRTHPPDPNAIREILQIIVRRPKQVRKKNDTNLTTTDNEAVDAEPLHIMVMGGSVTEGVNCADNPLRLNLNGKMCNWASKLERLFNEVLFEGLDVVKITNMGVGGSSSEIGALVMEYQLFPNNEIPHIIISSFAANDFRQPNLERVFYVEVQDFIQQAKNVRPCDKDLPLVVIADHMYGHIKVTDQHILSGYYAALAAWHDVMAFNHANVVRHELIGNYENATAISSWWGANTVCTW